MLILTVMHRDPSVWDNPEVMYQYVFIVYLNQLCKVYAYKLLGLQNVMLCSFFCIIACMHSHFYQ